MAGAGYKLFNTGDVLLASEVNTYLMQQTVMVFANSTARTSALSGVLAEGMISYLADTNATEVYNGTAWVGITGTGDITEVTAGTGISGGGTTGAVTITNSMATEITAKGDLIVGTGNATFDNLAVGTNGYTLVADSSTATGLKWASASSGGGYTLLDSGTLSSTSVAMTSISGSYRDLVIIVRDFLPDTSNAQLRGRYNNESSNYYSWTTNNAPVAATFDNGFFDMTAGANSSTANGLIHFRIYDYANTDTWKSAEVTAVVLNASNAATWNGNRTFVVYNQTTAISRFDLLLSTGNFTSGNYYLYGVK